MPKPGVARAHTNPGRGTTWFGNALAHEPLPAQAVPAGLHPHRHTLSYLVCWNSGLTLPSLLLAIPAIKRDVVSRPQLLTSPDLFVRSLLWVASPD